MIGKVTRAGLAAKPSLSWFQPDTKAKGPGAHFYARLSHKELSLRPSGSSAYRWQTLNRPDSLGYRLCFTSQSSSGALAEIDKVSKSHDLFSPDYNNGETPKPSCSICWSTTFQLWKSAYIAAMIRPRARRSSPIRSPGPTQSSS